MPINVDVLANRGLIYFRFFGFITVDEATVAFEKLSKSPDFKVGMRHFVDFSSVTGYEHNYVKVLALQANIADIVEKNGIQTLVVLLATTRQGREMANMTVKSWDGVAGVIPVIAETETKALELLGEREKTIIDLLAKA